MPGDVARAKSLQLHCRALPHGEHIWCPGGASCTRCNLKAGDPTAPPVDPDPTPATR